MDELKKILKIEMEKYAIKGLNDEAYFAQADSQNTYFIVGISELNKVRQVETDIIARIIEGKIIIEKDMNSKPLVDALEQAGVPREKIVLAYAGEKVPIVAE